MAELPPLPVEGADPWFEARNAFDLAVKDRLEGGLSDEQLALSIEGLINAAVNGVYVPIAGVAGEDTVGWARAVFIANGGTIPVGTPPNTIVIEAEA